MRVAHVCADPGVPVFGAKGASVHVQAIAAALARCGARVELLATRIGGDRPATLAGLGLHRLPEIPKGDAAQRERRALGANAELAERLRGLAPLDLVYERYSLFSHAAMEHARAAGIPAVLEVNAPLIDEQAAHRTLVHREEAERVAGRAFAAATAIVAVSEGVADWVARWPEARGRVHVVPNGVDPRRFPPVLAHDGPFTVGFLGTLKPWHGLDVLIDAFARLHARRPDARLLLVGDGPEAPRLRTAITERGLAAAVELAGKVDPAAVPAQLARMDVAVAPYPALEPFYFSPLKIVESMAAGLPVVSSRVGRLDRLVQDGTTGLLCPPGDPAALAGALDALAGDPGRRLAMGRAGRERVLAEHTWERVVARVLELAGLPAPRPRSRPRALVA